MKICKKLKEALKHEPIFFDAVGGCGIDPTLGKETCMAAHGLWFRYCPFCGSKIIMYKTKTGWDWTELSPSNFDEAWNLYNARESNNEH